MVKKEDTTERQHQVIYSRSQTNWHETSNASALLLPLRCKDGSCPGFQLHLALLIANFRHSETVTCSLPNLVDGSCTPHQHMGTTGLFRLLRFKRAYDGHLKYTAVAGPTQPEHGGRGR